VNVPDLKAYSSVAAKLLRRVTSYASSEALLLACQLLFGDPLSTEYIRPRRAVRNMVRKHTAPIRRVRKSMELCLNF
jgi:hypothetical protein